MTLLIDNYDSFSYNLFQVIGTKDPGVRVIRNDELSVNEIRALAPDRIVISPGPGKPADAGICVDLITQLHAEIPILGICLGHQAIYEAFGGTVSYAAELVHGKAAEVRIDTDDALFRGLPGVIQAARYHSLAAIGQTLPESLKVTAWAADGEIMAIAHRQFPVYGVQFHPESILTPLGAAIIENFLG